MLEARRARLSGTAGVPGADGPRGAAGGARWSWSEAGPRRYQTAPQVASIRQRSNVGSIRASACRCIQAEPARARATTCSQTWPVTGELRLSVRPPGRPRRCSCTPGLPSVFGGDPPFGSGDVSSPRDVRRRSHRSQPASGGNQCRGVRRLPDPGRSRNPAGPVSVVETAVHRGLPFSSSPRRPPPAARIRTGGAKAARSAGIGAGPAQRPAETHPLRRRSGRHAAAPSCRLLHLHFLLVRHRRASPASASGR